MKKMNAAFAMLVGLGAVASMPALTDPELGSTPQQRVKSDLGPAPQKPGAVEKAMRRLMGGDGRKNRRYPNGPGWTHAHVQRMARKRKNQLRNKRAHR